MSLLKHLWLFVVIGITLMAANGSVIAGEPTCGDSIVCTIADGSYRIEFPSGRQAAGVYVFFHGYQSSAALQMEDRALVDTALKHGLAFVAVDGLGGTWSHPNAPFHHRDDIAFAGRVLDDLQTRFGFGPDKVVLGGFSQGASMAWYSICRLGDRVSGAVTFSGVFWNPLPRPQDCPAVSPPLFHFHGRADRTFPLAGRAVTATAHQGDTFQSMAILRQGASCSTTNIKTVIVGGVTCRVDDCLRGSLSLCLHDGGHMVDPAWLDGALSQLGR